MNQDFVKGSYRALALSSPPPNAPPYFYLLIKEVQNIGNKYMQIRICISHNTKKRTFKI